MNALFQTIVRRDKKAFLRDQYKKTEESNRMGMTRDLFKKIRVTKGRFMQSWTQSWKQYGPEAEDIKKLWQEYTEELYKKGFHDPDYHDGVNTHLEPDILECQVKWALGSIIKNKASGGDRIPVEFHSYFKS